jgi:poly(A) polymerase Pap1
MPFIAKKSFYLEYLKEALAKLEKEKPKYKGIYNFKVRMLNIEELELFESIKEKIELEKVFEENDKNDSENFITTMGKINGNNRLGSDFLQEAYDRFFSKGVDWKLEE